MLDSHHSRAVSVSLRAREMLRKVFGGVAGGWGWWGLYDSIKLVLFWLPLGEIFCVRHGLIAVKRDSVSSFISVFVVEALATVVYSQQSDVHYCSTSN